MTSQEDLVKKLRLSQEKVKRYEKLSKSTTTKRSVKQKTYKKPAKGKKVGTETECQKIADKTGGNIDKQLLDKLLNASVKKRPVVRRKGGSLLALMIKKLIVASHEEDFKDVGDYKIDRQLSHEWVHVYYNDEKRHCVIVHRGSADAYDAFIDLQLFVQHKNNKRFKISEQVQKKAEKKYCAKGYFITTLGSSLGAYLSEEYGQNSDEVITVSKPTTPIDLLMGKKKGKDQYDI